MGKLVILKIGNGNFEGGFPVTLQIGEDGSTHEMQLEGWLPANQHIVEHYSNWCKNCFPKPGLKLISSKKYLIDNLTGWLNSEKFLTKMSSLFKNCTSNDQLRVIVQTEHIELQRLPWHLWEFFEDYPKAEIALSPLEYQKVSLPTIARENIKILGILGNSDGIDVEKDREIIENLPNVDIPIFLVEPNPIDITDKLWEQPWDILFFAGHSETKDNTGRIYINKNDSLTIEDLKYGLQKAIARGLKIAIFNSCDGLGLARELASLHIPQVIVMREPVPDFVAQEFLKYFLQAFSRGEPLYLALREARERLQGLEKKFPCASWLPVIYQNTAEIPPTWDTLRGINPNLNWGELPKKVPLTTDFFISESELNLAAPASAWKVDENQLYSALLRLDYQSQEELFRDFFQEHPLGCFLLEGKSACGQEFLLERLLNLTICRTTTPPINIDLARKCQTNFDDLLRLIGRKVGVRNDYSFLTVAQGIYEQWQSSNVIIVLNCIHSIPEDYWHQIISFWNYLGKFGNGNYPNNDYSLLMFLVDYGGSLNTPNITFTNRLSPVWQPHIPVSLPIITKFSEETLITWARELSNIFPRSVIKQIKGETQSLLKNSDDGLPELVMQEICDLLNCNWDNIRRKINV